MGYCPECGFKIGPEAYYCSYCGNRNFFMTMEKYLDDCDVCVGAVVQAGSSACKACSGKGFREYRVFKDSRTGALHCDQLDNIINRVIREQKL